MDKWITLTLILLLAIALISAVGVTLWVQAEAPLRKDSLASARRAQAAFVRDMGKSGARLLAVRAVWTSRLNETGAKPAGNRQLVMQIAHRMARDAGRQALSSFTGASVAGGPRLKQNKAKLGREQIP